MCDSLHVTSLASDVVSRAAIFLSRYLLLDIPQLLWSRGSYAYINFNELLWNYENLTSLKIRTFYLYYKNLELYGM